MKRLIVFLSAAVLLLVLGCDTGPKSAKGFRLPDGDVGKGKVAFIELKCNTCHTVHGVELPAAEAPAPATVALGGEVIQVKSYGQLVTSIINPSHKLSKHFEEVWAKTGEGFAEETEGSLSPMPQFNDKMTVGQMIDLVAFLQSHYVKLEPAYDHYGYYP